MDDKDKEICFDLLMRGLRTSYNPVLFQGPAENFEKFDDPNFTKFAAKHDINPETRIKVWKRGSDSFNVFPA